VLQGIVHVFAAGVDVHLDAVPQRVVGRKCRLGGGDVALLQRRDRVYEGRADRLDAGDLETLARFRRFYGACLSGLTEHDQGCEQTKADRTKLPGQARHRFLRDHCVLPSFVFGMTLKKESEHV